MKTKYCKCAHNPLNTKKLVLQCKMEVKYLLDIALGEEAISIHASNPNNN
jgi:hypothetical protein